MAGLAALGLLALVLVLVRDQGYRPDPGPATAQGARPALAAATLSDLEAALGAGDAGAAAALAPAGDRSAADLLAGVARNARDLGVRDLRLRYVSEVSATRAGAWPAEVELSWRVAGVDRRRVAVDTQVTFRNDGDRVRVTGLGGGVGRTPVWWAGPASVTPVPGVGAVVIADGAAAQADYPRLVRRAGSQVRSVIPRWSGEVGVVFEMPAGSEGVDRALGVEPGEYADVAGVTASADGSSGARAPVRIVLDPQEMGSLETVGRQIVLTHELTHAALGSATTRASVPPWLTEGVADVVALRTVRLPLSTTAANIAARVRREGVPRRLPGEAEFAAGSSERDAAYESSWIACQVIVDRVGIDGLLAVYRAVLAGRPVEVAVRRHGGITRPQLVREWRARLVGLAAAQR